MNFKIKKVIYYKEYLYIFWGIAKKILKIKNLLYRFYLPILRQQLNKKVFFNNINEYKKNLKNKFGDFSDYKIIADETLKNVLLESADKILNYEFNLLGGSIKFANKIDWHTDFKSGFTWEKGFFYLKYKQVELSNNADVKVPRELSRSHHFIILGQAYLLTKDEKYTKEFIAEIEDWIKENHLMYSINWGCTMDVAIRAANWVFALNMFIDSPLVTAEFLNKILKSLYEHGIFISNNLEKSYKVGANHLDGDIGGLLLVGLIFNKDKQGRRWFDLSKYLLFDEIRKQILPSGMEIEKSCYYNRLVLEIFAYLIFILKRNNIQIPADIEYRIHSMFRFLREIMLEDYALPIFGDYDSARFVPFDTIYRNDVKYLCKIAEKYYNDDFFILNCDSQCSELFFLLNNNKTINCNYIPRISKSVLENSYFYSDIGIVKLKSNDLCIYINNSSPGRFVDDPFMSGSHAHADLLSFVLTKGQQQIFIDPGSGVYTSDYKLRNMLRSTSMHNTVTINNMSQFRFNEHDLFNYYSKAEVNNLKFSDENDLVVYEGEHNAYSYLKSNLIHRRKYELYKKTKILLISDTIFNGINNTATINFILHPCIQPQLIDNIIYLYINQNQVASIFFNSNEEEKFLKIIDVSYSIAYGHIGNTKKIEFSSNLKHYISSFKIRISFS